MSMIDRAVEATPASGVKVVTSAAGTLYSLSNFPLSTAVSIATGILTVFYIYSAAPRVWRTTVALKRGLINKDWSLWRTLGNQPIPTKED